MDRTVRPTAVKSICEERHTLYTRYSHTAWRRFVRDAFGFGKFSGSTGHIMATHVIRSHVHGGF